MKCPHCKKTLTKIKIELLPTVIGDELTIPLDTIRVITCPNCDVIIKIVYHPELS